MSRPNGSFIYFSFSDDTFWEVPVQTVAIHRAKHEAYRFGNDLEWSLIMDTIPLFTGCGCGPEIEKWAEMMTWDDVKGAARKIETERLDPSEYPKEWERARKHSMDRTDYRVRECSEIRVYEMGD